MFIKAYAGDGRWRILEVSRDRGIEWSTHRIAVPCKDDEGNLDWDFLADERIPDAESGQLLITPDGFVPREGMAGVEKHAHPDAPAMRFFRWVKWDTGEGAHVLVTDGPVFVMNAEGQTIERLR